MPAWWLIPGAIKAGTSIAGYLSARRNKIPNFANTQYGQQLKTQGEQGIYSPDTQSKMLSETTRMAGNIASGRIASTRGYLASRGMGTSIAGVRALDQPVQDVQRQVSEQANQLQIANEQSKIAARERYAEMLYENMLRRKRGAKEDVGALLGGLAGAGLSAYEAKMADLENKDLEELIQIWLKKKAENDAKK